MLCSVKEARLGQLLHIFSHLKKYRGKKGMKIEGGRLEKRKGEQWERGKLERGERCLWLKCVMDTSGTTTVSPFYTTSMH